MLLNIQGDFFSIYWHRDCVLRLSIEKFTESYRKWCLRRNYKFRTNTAHKLYALAQDAVPTLPKNNGTKALVLQACKSLNAVCAYEKQNHWCLSELR